jgi:hypothetical protein
MIYSTDNLLSVYSLSSVTTEDSLYVKDYLYDNRPSRPFRFTSKSAQRIVIDLSSAKPVTIAALFNHNLTAAATVKIQANTSNSWTSPAFTQTLSWRNLDLYALLSQTYRWWSFYVDDPTNTLMPEIGLAWLGTWSKFPNARVNPGRVDSPEFFQVEQVTSYGQDWTAYLSDSQTFELGLTNLISPSAVDDIHAFLRAIYGAAGRFVFIPDETQPHVYFVRVLGNPSSNRITYSASGELRGWSIKLKALTHGIVLI